MNIATFLSLLNRGTRNLPLQTILLQHILSLSDLLFHHHYLSNLKKRGIFLNILKDLDPGPFPFVNSMFITKSLTCPFVTEMESW